MCVQSFCMVNIDVPAGVGVPPLDTQLHMMQLLGLLVSPPSPGSQSSAVTGVAASSSG